MADLLVISFPTEAQAEEARTRVASMQREYLIELGDAVVALRKPDGSIKLNQTFHPTAAGAAGGAMWGALIGLLFLNPLAGAAMGAGPAMGAGAWGAMSEMSKPSADWAGEGREPSRNSAVTAAVGLAMEGWSFIFPTRCR